MGFFDMFKQLNNNQDKEKIAEDVCGFSSPEDFLGTEEAYFEQLLSEENFVGFTVERNVHVSRYDKNAHPACFPVSFLFSKASKPVLAVYLMKPNQYRAMIARGSYKVLEDNNIPYIRFFRGFDNEKDYVIGRVKSNLK